MKCGPAPPSAGEWGAVARPAGVVAVLRPAGVGCGHVFCGDGAEIAARRIESKFDFLAISNMLSAVPRPVARASAGAEARTGAGPRPLCSPCAQHRLATQ